MLDLRAAVAAVWQWKNLRIGFSTRGVANRAPERGVRPSAESLEARRLLAAVVVRDFGDITNPATLQIVDGTINDQLEVVLTERFKFSLGRSAVVVAELSDLEKVRFLNSTLFGQLTIVSLDASGNSVGAIGSKIFSASLTDPLQLSLPPGQYAADFISDTVDANVNRFDLAIHADTAPGQFSSGTLNPVSTVGRNIGVLSTASGNRFGEFIGAFPDFVGSLTDQRVGHDGLDVFLFDVVKQGSVTFTVDADNGNNRGSFTDPFNFSLVRDINNNGVFQLGTSERIRFETISPGENFTTSQSLAPGRYELVVEQATLFNGGLNYQIQTSYSVADGAGNTLAAANTAAGTVGNGNVTFNDYLAPNDAFDIYRFTTVAGGPFVFTGTLSGMGTGSNFELDFIRDLDADGAIDNNEVISSDRTGNANEELSVPHNTPNTIGIFVRVRRTAGEGVYTLAFNNRSTDLAGNTLASALNFVTIPGSTEFNDIVSATDVDDFYKFTLNVQAEFDAQLTGMPAGSNANLSLIRDNDGDGVIDPGETLSVSNNANNASETIATNLTAGTYVVRVSRVAGSPTYKLRLIKDSAASTPPFARSLSPNGGGELEFVGSQLDDDDVYTFTIASSRQVAVSLGSNTEPLLFRLGQDTNGDGVIGFDGPELRINKTIASGTGAGADSFQRINLTAGTYFLLVNPTIQDDGSNYHVTVFNEPPDFAGNTLAAARDLGTLRAVKFISDFVGTGSIALMDDLVDFYRFTLGNDGPFVFHAQFNLLTGGNANLQLIRDDNLNDEIDIGEVVSTTSLTGTALDTIDITLKTPGTHYLRVFRVDGQASHLVSMSANTQDTAGNSTGAALDLGPLGTSNNPNHFVGFIDRDDFFKFSVNAPGELLAVLSGVDSATRMEVLRDSGQILANSAGFIGLNDELNGVFLPAAGTYFVHVLTEAGDSTYNISLQVSNQTPFLGAPFQINNTGSTRIEVENFDNGLPVNNGGEGIAYHDATATNDGGVFRTNESVEIKATVDPQGGNFRIATTAVGEFLEYTIFVNQAGNYDFDFRVASPDQDAAFHAEIDGVNVTGTQNVPDTTNTNSFDVFQTVTKTNVPLTAGPHILRLAFDGTTGLNNGFAGSYNFITIRPSGSTGTFELTPSHSTVRAGKSAKVALEWTVPSGGWRVLSDVQLRFKDEGGRTILRIKFNEASNTFRLYDTKKRKWGKPRIVGSHGVLSNKYAKVSLSKSTVQADGPNDPSVVITFDVTFKKKLKGEHLTIEAAASDDLGHSDPFAPAGTLNLR